jgi:hypothetical protein
MTDALQIVGDISKLTLTPDDVLVIKIPKGMGNKNFFANLEKSCRKIFGDNQRFLVIEGDVQLEIVAANKVDEEESSSTPT